MQNSFLISSIDLVHTKTSVGPPVSSAVQLEDRVSKLSASYSMFAAFESSDKSVSRNYNSSSSRTGDAYGRAFDVSSPLNPSMLSASVCSEGPNEGAAIERHDNDKRQRFDKQDVKKRWQVLFANVDSLVESLYTLDQDRRPKLQELLQAVDEVAFLPSYVESPGESFMSTFYNKLREIVRALKETRTWAAKMNDLLHKGYALNRSLKTADKCNTFETVESLHFVDATLESFKATKEKEREELLILAERAKEKRLKSGKDAKDFEEELTYNEQLRRILTEGQSLAVRTDEEMLLRNMLRFFDKWCNRAHLILGDSKINTKKVKLHKDAIPTIIELINQAYNLPLEIFDHTLTDLISIYIKYLEAHDDISHFLFHASVARHSVTAKKTGMSKIFNMKDAKRKMFKLQSYFEFPLPGLKDYENIIIAAESWLSQVAEVSGSTVSIRKVEQLISIGEGFPFDFKNELDMLRDKRQLAKQWVEKVNASLVRGSSRYSRRGQNAVDADIEKPSFEVLKQIVSEGEGFLSKETTNVSSMERAQNKEMHRVVTIVEAAEEWQSKLRETFTVSETDAALAMEELKELLKEAEKMPIVMDEVHILKAQLQLLEWGACVKSCIDSSPSGHLKYKEAKEHLKKLENVYDSIEKQYRADVKANIKVTEELIVREYVKEGQHWISKSKDLFQGNVIKKDASLKRLRDIYDLASSMKVDLSTEVQPVEHAINAAETWIADNESLLLKLSMHFGTIPVKESNSHSEVEYNEGEIMNIDSDGEDAKSKDRKTGVYISGVVDISHITRAASTCQGLAATFAELTTFRGLSDSCSDWIKKFKEMCPARQQSRRKATSRSAMSSEAAFKKEEGSKPTTKDLCDLMDEIDKMGVAFPEEKMKLSVSLRCIEDWTAEAVKFREKLNSELLEIAAQYSEVAIADKFPFPCLSNVAFDHAEECKNLATLPSSFDDVAMKLKGDSDGSFEPAVSEEEEIWNALHAIMENVNEKLQEYDDLFLQIDDWEDMHLIARMLHWMSSARRLLCNPDWTDNFEEEIIQHIKDAACLYPLDKLLERSAMYENSVQIPQSIFSSLLKLVPIDDVKIDDEGRRSTRKKNDINWARRIAESTSMKSKKRKFDDAEPAEVITESENIAENSVDVETEGARAYDESNENMEFRDQADDAPAEEMGVDDMKSKSKKSRRGNSKQEPIPEQLTPNPQKAKFAPVVYLRPFKNSFIKVDKCIEDLLDYWMRCLLILLGRLNESSAWLRDVQHIKSTKTTYSDIQSKVELGKRRNLPKKHRQLLESLLTESIKWKQRAQLVLTNDDSQLKIGIDDALDLLSKGEKMTIIMDELEELKGYIDEYDTWNTKFEHSGIAIGLAANVDLNEMLAEGRALKFDATEQLDTITSNMKAYCICRMHYYGDMIGCDYCDEWYHLSCVGLTSVQAESVENFRCMRCLIRQSFNASAMQCRKIIDTWTNVSILHERHKLLMTKIFKRINREHNLLKRREAEYDLMKRKETIVSDDSQPIILSEVSNSSNQNSSPILEGETSNETLNSLKNEVQKLKENLDSLRDEERVLRAQNERELSCYELVVPWMTKIQCALMPKDEMEEAIGRPVLSPGDLPMGIARLLEDADANGIRDIPDIQLITDKFRWMTWCFCCLYALRAPITEGLNRFLQKTAQEIPNKGSDTLVKGTLNGILVRSMPWKKRVRRLCDVQPKEKRPKVGNAKETSILNAHPLDISSEDRMDLDSCEKMEVSGDDDRNCNEDHSSKLNGEFQMNEAVSSTALKSTKIVAVDATRVVFAHQESSTIALNTRLKSMLKSGLEECRKELIQRGKSDVAEKLTKFHRTEEIRDSKPADKKTKKEKDKGKEKDSDTSLGGKKGKLSKCIPELADVIVSLVVPDSFSSEEEYDDEKDSHEKKVDTDSTTGRNSLTFSRLLNHQSFLSGPMSVAEDPHHLWPVNLQQLVSQENESKEDESRDA